MHFLKLFAVIAYQKFLSRPFLNFASWSISYWFNAVGFGAITTMSYVLTRFDQAMSVHRSGFMRNLVNLNKHKHLRHRTCRYSIFHLDRAWPYDAPKSLYTSFKARCWTFSNFITWSLSQKFHTQGTVPEEAHTKCFNLLQFLSFTSRANTFTSLLGLLIHTIYDGQILIAQLYFITIIPGVRLFHYPLCLVQLMCFPSKYYHLKFTRIRLHKVVFEPR